MKKLSFYHIAVPHVFEDGKMLLYSTISGKCLAISEDLYKKWLKGLLSLRTREMTQDASSPVSSFFADDTEDEFTNVQQLLLEKRHSQKFFTLTILPTMQCNFACVYCHEDGYRTGNAMSMDTEEALVRWTKKMLDTYSPEKLIVYFYGGEPLLVPDTICRLSERFARVAKDRCYLELHLTTNGWFLDRGMAQRLEAHNIIHLQVSLDGPPHIHNQRRMTVEGVKSFERILGNLEISSQILDIVIRVNLDAHNGKKAAAILELLANSGLSKNIRVACDPVSQTHSNNRFISENLLSDVEAAKYMVQFWEEMIRLDFPMPSSPFSQGICGILPILSLSVNPEGKLFLCSGLIHFESLAIGNVFSGIESGRQHRQCSLINWESCRACQWLPVCGGGCRAQGFMAEGHESGIACQRNYLDRIVPAYLKLVWGQDRLKKYPSFIKKEELSSVSKNNKLNQIKNYRRVS